MGSWEVLMKEDKEIIEEVWEKQPCQNPLEPAQWSWVRFAKGSRALILTCLNSIWWNHHK